MGKWLNMFGNGAANPEAGESSKAKLIGLPPSSQPARLSLKIVISLFSDTHARVSEMLAQIQLPLSEWGDPPPPCWEKLPNNPVFFLWRVPHVYCIKFYLYRMKKIGTTVLSQKSIWLNRKPLNSHLKVFEPQYFRSNFPKIEMWRDAVIKCDGQFKININDLAALR